LVGAVVGVGLAGGAKAVDFRVFGKIAASWVASVPVAAFGAATIYVLSGGDNLKMIILLPIAFMTVAYVMWTTRDGEIYVEDALSEAGSGEVSIEVNTPKAQTPFELFHEHAEAVEVTVGHMLSAVNKSADGKDASKEIKATIDAELDADNIKAELRARMAETDIRLIVSMDDFLHMLTRQDRIADYAQNVAEQLSFRELYNDKKARKMLKEMAEAVSETVSVYEDTVLAMRDLSIGGETKIAKEKVAKLIKEVNLKEHAADEIEAKAAAHVFSTGDDDALAAMHMYRVLQRMDDVANACEKAANAFLPSLTR
jgi:predicted phosphate transport protein (TIGR00153 family)